MILLDTALEAEGKPIRVGIVASASCGRARLAIAFQAAPVAGVAI